MNTSLVLSAVFMLAMVIVIAPNIFAINKGHILRNVAIWLAVFSALALFYKNFGPGSPHPLFNQPAAMIQPTTAPANNAPAENPSFTPPRE
jgi:hypothetical protein